MVEFDTKGSDEEYGGCIIALDVSVKNEGLLEEEQLEQIDSVMLEFGSSRTGQRLEVNSKPDMVRSRVKYVYQETFNAKSFETLSGRFKVKTNFEDFFITVGTEFVNLVEMDDNG